MTWALCIAAWWLLSVPIGCIAARLIRDDPSVPRDVGTALFLPPTNLDTGRSLTTGGSQAAGVPFKG